MRVESGTQFAQLLLRAFDGMVDEVRVDLERAGHAGLTVKNELAMQAIDNGANSAASLARATGTSRQAAAKVIAVLEELGYVTREGDSSDARKKNLTVTSSGHDAIRIGAATFDKIFDRWQRETGAASTQTIEALHRLIADR